MERVILRHVPEPGAQRLLIEKGDADIARNLTADQIAGLEGNDDIVIQTDPKATMIYLQVSMRDPVLSKPKVREALRYVIDYQGMAESFLRGQYNVHQSFWPSGFFASLTDDAVRTRRCQGQGSAGRGRAPGRHRGRDGCVQHRALCRHRAGGAGDHGRGRHQRLDRTGGDQGGLRQAPGAQFPDDPDPLEPGLPGPALQRRRLRLQSRTIPTRPSSPA